MMMMIISVWTSCCANHAEAETPPLRTSNNCKVQSKTSIVCSIIKRQHLPDLLKTLTLATSDLPSIFLTHVLYLSFSLSLAPLAGRFSEIYSSRERLD